MKENYYKIQMQYPSIIFSHLSSLFLNNVIKKAPIMLTLENNYHNKNLNKYELFYIKKEQLKIGLIIQKTSDGKYLKYYDIERTICDLIRSSKRIDNKICKNIFKNHIYLCNIEKLYNYALLFNIEKQVRSYLFLS